MHIYSDNYGWNFLLIGYQIYQKSGQTSKDKNIVIEVVYNSNLASDIHKITTNSKTLGEALDELKIAEFIESPYGRYIISINKIKADESKQEWWGISINNEFAQTGIDNTNLVDGYTYSLALNKGY